MNWFTVKSSDMVWAPIGQFVTKKGELKTRFVKLGIKITMMDGAWWFYSFKHGSWTKHWVPVPKMDKLGRPLVEGGKLVYLPERKETYRSYEALQKEWGTRKPELIRNLTAALETALEPAEA